MQSLFHKIAVISIVQGNSNIDFEKSNNGLVDGSSLDHYTTASLLPSFSIRSIKCHSRFVHENYFRKVNFQVFLVSTVSSFDLLYSLNFNLFKDLSADQKFFSLQLALFHI